MKKNLNKQGIIFWITGLSGSGKTTLAKNIKKFVSKNYGPTICIHGDEIRSTFNLKSYNKSDRLKIAKMYVKLVRILTNQKINVIFSVVGLFHELQKYNRRMFKNYLEIFIKSDIQVLIKKKRKAFYRKKTNNVWGIDLKPEFPKKPDITIINDFKKDKKSLTKELILKIKKTDKKFI